MTTMITSASNNSLKRTLSNERTSQKSSPMIFLRRLATFQSWKENPYEAISKSQLAKTGLSYDAIEHRLKCAECKFEFDLNQTDIDPTEEHLKQYPQCDFALLRSTIFPQIDPQLLNVTSTILGIESDNSNLHNHMETNKNNQLDELSSQRSFLQTLSTSTILQLQTNTFTNWPSITPNAKDMIAAGWSYTNITDRVVCIHCNIIVHKWTETDRPYEIHRLKSPQCPFVVSYEKTLENTSTPILITTTPNTQATAEAANTQYLLPCQRHESFKNWPHTEENPLPSIESFVDAGFFYTGDATVVRCFYCNNALRNWQSTDDPKIEHARWYPQCRYIRQYIGEDLYQAIQRKNRELKEQQKYQNNMTNQKSQLNLWTNDEIDRMVKARLDLPIIEKIRQLGFTMPVIRKTLEMQLRFKKDDFPTDNDLRYACLILDLQVKLINGSENIILVPQDWMKTYFDNQQQNTQQEKSPQSQTISLPIKNNEIPKLTVSVASQPKIVKQPDEETMSCVLCLTTERQVACLPCGHLMSCVACGHSLKVCPLCRAPVKAFVRIYM